MTVPATISVTEAAGFTALRGFLLQATGLPGGQVIQGQQNRVGEPLAGDFILMWSLRLARLATNTTSFFDNIITGSIAGNLLTVATMPQSQGAGLQPGMLLIDSVWPTMNVAPDTAIVEQVSGTPGGTGTYTVTASQTLALETLYAGLRVDFVPTEWTVQLDIHGPNSANYANIIQDLFRSEYGVLAIGEPSSWNIVPLYCGDAHQLAFINAESQFEQRFSMDAHLQIQPIIGTSAQFFDQIEVQPIEAYPVDPAVDGAPVIVPNPNPPTHPERLIPWPPNP